MEMLEGGTRWRNALKILRENDSQLRIIYPAEVLNEVE